MGYVAFTSVFVQLISLTNLKLTIHTPAPEIFSLLAECPYALNSIIEFGYFPCGPATPHVPRLGLSVVFRRLYCLDSIDM